MPDKAISSKFFILHPGYIRSLYSHFLKNFQNGGHLKFLPKMLKCKNYALSLTMQDGAISLKSANPMVFKKYTQPLLNLKKWQPFWYIFFWLEMANWLGSLPGQSAIPLWLMHNLLWGALKYYLIILNIFHIYVFKNMLWYVFVCDCDDCSVHFSTSKLGQEIFILVSENSGKSQGILFPKMSRNPVKWFTINLSLHVYKYYAYKFANCTIPLDTAHILYLQMCS